MREPKSDAVNTRAHRVMNPHPHRHQDAATRLMGRLILKRTRRKNHTCITDARASTLIDTLISQGVRGKPPP